MSCVSKRAARLVSGRALCKRACSSDVMRVNACVQLSAQVRVCLTTVWGRLLGTVSRFSPYVSQGQSFVFGSDCQRWPSQLRRTCGSICGLYGALTRIWILYLGGDPFPTLLVLNCRFASIHNLCINIRIKKAYFLTSIASLSYPRSLVACPLEAAVLASQEERTVARSTPGS